MIAATFVHLGAATAVRVMQPVVGLALFAVALVVAWRVKGAWVTPAIVIGGGIVGWLALS